MLLCALNLDLLQLTVASRDAFEKEVEDTPKAVDIVTVEILGPLTLTIPHEIKQNILRMGAVSIVAAFEAFAYDAMWQSFTVICEHAR